MRMMPTGLCVWYMMHLTWQNDGLIWNMIKDAAEVLGSLPCPFHFLTGLYCPGCGGTRAVMALLTGNWKASLYYHPFVLYMTAAAGAEAALWIWGKIRRRPVEGFEKRYRFWTIGALLVVGANWIFKNYMLIVKGTARL